MKQNKSFFSIIFVFLLLITPISSSYDSNDTNSTEENIDYNETDTSNSTDDNINSTFSDGVVDETNNLLEEDNKTKTKSIKESSQQKNKIEKPEGKEYLTNQKTQEKYEIKKLGNRKY